MTVKSKWEAIPVALKWTVSAVSVIMVAIGYLTTYQTDAEAQAAHDTIKKDVDSKHVTLEQAYRNDRIDRHEREIFKWEDEIDDLDIDDPEYDKDYKKYERRIEQLNKTIDCIRNETC